MKTISKRRIDVAGLFVLTSLVLFMAFNLGFELYRPHEIPPTAPYGAINIITGKAEFQTPDSASWNEVTDNMAVEPGVRIKTIASSRAWITFFDGSTTTLDPETDVTITRLDAATLEKQPNMILLRQQSGTTWNHVTKLPGNYHFEIETPSANARVRGTVFLTKVDRSGHTLLRTTEGQVDVLASGKEVSVFAAQQIEVNKGEIPTTPDQAPLPARVFTIKVDGPVTALVKDPAGAVISSLNNEKSRNQILGSETTLQNGQLSFKVPEPLQGDYQIIVSGLAAGKSNVSAEVISGNKTLLKKTTSLMMNPSTEQTVLVHLDSPELKPGDVIKDNYRVSGKQPDSGPVNNPATTARNGSLKTEPPTPFWDPDTGKWRLTIGLIMLVIGLWSGLRVLAYLRERS